MKNCQELPNHDDGKTYSVFRRRSDLLLRKCKSIKTLNSSDFSVWVTLTWYTHGRCVYHVKRASHVTERQIKALTQRSATQMQVLAAPFLIQPRPVHLGKQQKMAHKPGSLHWHEGPRWSSGLKMDLQVVSQWIESLCLSFPLSSYAFNIDKTSLYKTF